MVPLNEQWRIGVHVLAVDVVGREILVLFLSLYEFIYLCDEQALRSNWFLLYLSLMGLFDLVIELLGHFLIFNKLIDEILKSLFLNFD